MHKLVIAGTYDEYKRFIKEYSLDPNQHQYIYDSSNIRGRRDPHGYFIGTWRQRKDIGEVVETLWLSMSQTNEQFNEILKEVRSMNHE